MGQSIEDDRRALEAEGAVKIRKIEVDYEQFEVSAALPVSAAVTDGHKNQNQKWCANILLYSSRGVHCFLGPP